MKSIKKVLEGKCASWIVDCISSQALKKKKKKTMPRVYKSSKQTESYNQKAQLSPPEDYISPDQEKRMKSSIRISKVFKLSKTYMQPCLHSTIY